jgi:hypothetical protein
VGESNAIWTSEGEHSVSTGTLFEAISRYPCGLMIVVTRFSGRMSTYLPDMMSAWVSFCKCAVTTCAGNSAARVGVRLAFFQIAFQLGEGGGYSLDLLATVPTPRLATCFGEEDVARTTLWAERPLLFLLIPPGSKSSENKKRDHRHHRTTSRILKSFPPQPTTRRGLTVS